ncbi:MAG: ABC transporter permease [Deltaproteobacteria bacterium]|nr:ABC transporter permease [Deltaproteobacteria bacterium]MBW2307172.1 ABC transporter permease [Deltaproteobacteria bacterium]
MLNYIIRRSLQSVLICLAISLVTFFLLFLATDPALMLLPPEATIQEVEAFKEKMGLNDPIAIQYFRWLGRLVFHGDFGNSFVIDKSASSLLLERFPATIELAIGGLLVTIMISVPLGIIAAIRRHSLTDNFATLLAVLGQAMPLFWLGIMLIIIFGVWLRLLPTSGREGWISLILPAITLGGYLAPMSMRLTRSRMLEVLNQDYIRTARAKGLKESVVLVRHAFRNAAIPVVVIIGMQFGALMGGAVVTETVFGWPGVGRLAVQAIKTGDIPVVQAAVIILAFMIVMVNLLADVITAFLDPRIKFG